ncbi:hypothetical protein MLD38_009210 [Melastoma candidum]|uniref:Uncharacterized protein n=1 Tax=Melastoma candidum TaxID=119954 RepID=A0ACB9RY85_9MYRT|nr:hypothetical protein MLD38_009210 [Melastoma candidum]
MDDQLTNETKSQGSHCTRLSTESSRSRAALRERGSCRLPALPQIAWQILHLGFPALKFVQFALDGACGVIQPGFHNIPTWLCWS